MEERVYCVQQEDGLGVRMKNGKRLKERQNIINVIPSNSKQVVSARLHQQYCHGV